MSPFPFLACNRSAKVTHSSLKRKHSSKRMELDLLSWSWRCNQKCPNSRRSSSASVLANTAVSRHLRCELRGMRTYFSVVVEVSIHPSRTRMMEELGSRWSGSRQRENAFTALLFLFLFFSLFIPSRPLSCEIVLHVSISGPPVVVLPGSALPVSGSGMLH